MVRTPVLVFALALSLSLPLFAATPPEGTVAPESPAVSWSGGPFLASNPASCVPDVDPTCDRFALTVAPPPTGGWAVVIDIAGANAEDDYDLFVYDSEGNLLDGSASAGGEEQVVLFEPPAGTYTVEVQPFLVLPGSTYSGGAFLDTSVEPGEEPSKRWEVTLHGACCEGNLAAAGAATYVLLPELLTGNDIKRSLDGGASWEKVYPPADVSVPFGIEGDLAAYGDDAVYFGTELTHGVAARSSDRGESWTVVQIPVAFAANDQAWLYMGPGLEVCPVQTVPYVLTGWYRIGTVALFSCDGGLTWPIQTPLVGLNGDGPAHVVCETNAHDPASGGSDTRIADADFQRMRAGRHGGWGTDGKFYWTQVSGDALFVCKTADFGVNWAGVRHPLATGTPAGQVVTGLAFDDRGTLYVLHANKLYVSFDQGASFRYVHTLPRWGDDPSVADGAGALFVVDRGTVHLAIKEAAPGGLGRIVYLRGKHVDTHHPMWKAEEVTTVDPVRLDFMQIVLDGAGIPTIGFTGEGGDTATASRDKAP